MKNQTTTAPLLILVITSFLVACSRHALTETAARDIAKQRIEHLQSTLNINARLLPPLSGKKSDDGFVFTTRDEAQNISIIVHVTGKGLPELSALPLTEERRRQHEGLAK